MTEARKLKIRRLVHDQILYYLSEDLKGGELLMKECWEQCRDDQEIAVAEGELRDVIAAVRNTRP